MTWKHAKSDRWGPKPRKMKTRADIKATYRSTPRGRQVERAYNKRRYQENHAWLRAYKVRRGCTDCGAKPDDPKMLHFDHARGQKRFNLAKVTTQALATVMAEVAKCDVVCESCHKKRTKARGQYAGSPHRLPGIADTSEQLSLL